MTESEIDPQRSQPTSPRGLAALAALARQWWVERSLRARDGSFRITDPATVGDRYGAMSADEFEHINAPQQWWNERVLARALADVPTDRPWRMVDLGCGSGGSSRLLAALAPPGSTLIGYELVEDLVARARAAEYFARDGEPIEASFVQQSIVEPLRDPAGSALDDGSVDVAASAGIVGHHLTAAHAADLARELQRVVAPDGVAILDAGPALCPRELRAIVVDRGFQHLRTYRPAPFAMRAAIAFRRQAVPRG